VLHRCCSERALLATPDVAHLLSMSLVMLNTSLHNPNIRDDRRTTLDAFLHTNTDYGKDINQGRPLPTSLLTSLYNDIAECSIRPPTAGDLIPEWCGGGGWATPVGTGPGGSAVVSNDVLASTVFSRSVWFETMRGATIQDSMFVPQYDGLAEVYAAMTPMVSAASCTRHLCAVSKSVCRPFTHRSAHSHSVPSSRVLFVVGVCVYICLSLSLLLSSYV
jgi:hypothetical protein